MHKNNSEETIRDWPVSNGD